MIREQEPSTARLIMESARAIEGFQTEIELLKENLSKYESFPNNHRFNVRFKEDSDGGYMTDRESFSLPITKEKMILLITESIRYSQEQIKNHKKELERLNKLL